MEKPIADLLKDFSVTPNKLGYYYLHDAIKLYLEDPGIIFKVTKELYPRLAAMYDTRPACVERSIRHAISTSWDSADRALRDDVFRSVRVGRKGYPTNGAYIATLAVYLRIKEEV